MYNQKKNCVKNVFNVPLHCALKGIHLTQGCFGICCYLLKFCCHLLADFGKSAASENLPTGSQVFLLQSRVCEDRTDLNRPAPPPPCYATGVQERSGGERHCAGSSQSHTLCEGSDRPRGVPLLLGYRRPTRLGE